MADNTAIEWADTTWNPLLGCERVSPGCDHCYAINTATIRAGHPHPKVATAFAGLTERRDGRLDWTGRINLLADRLREPLGWKKPRKIFVNSQSDLFHKDVPDYFIARVFAVMGLAQQHTFQLLTKRHSRMRSLLSSPEFHRLVADTAPLYSGNPDLAQDFVTTTWPLPNVHLGVSVESQQWADIRIPALLDTPAAVRWLSMEPLLGPTTLREEWLTCGHESHSGTAEPDVWVCDGCGQVRREVEDPNGSAHVFQVNPRRTYRSRNDLLAPGRLINWVVVGGESGPGSRPMHAAWARNLRDQCTAAGVPFFFKQWGDWLTVRTPSGEHRERVGKKRAGRELDGRTWDEHPTARTAVA